MAARPVEVHGLKELRSELRKLEDQSSWKPALKDAGLQAGEIVASTARSSAAGGATTLGGHHAYMGGAALATIRVLAQQTRVFIAGGKGVVKWYGGWEFGSAGAYRQFPAKKTDGYNIYPAIGKNIEQVIEAYAKGVEPLLKQAFPD